MKRAPRLALLGIAASSALLAQEPAAVPQYRAGVELLQLTATVLDGKRQPVRGLSAEDFVVLDNGRETAVRAFTPVELARRTRAGEAVWESAVAPDVATNEVAGREGKLVVIVLDRSIPPDQPTVVARKAAKTVIAELGPYDLAAVVSTSGGRVQNLTSDKVRLAHAIDASQLSTDMTVDTRLIEEERLRSMGLPIPNPLSDGRCLCGLCVLETITHVADALQGVTRRPKIMVFIGSNIVLQSTSFGSGYGPDVACEFRLRDARREMLSAVDRAHLTVHAIDPQGLLTLGPMSRASAGNGVDRPGRPAAAQRARQQDTETSDRLASLQSLELLPDRTGGRSLIGKNNPERDVAAMLAESDAYYVLGIERGTPDRPDQPRSLEVRVRRKGLRAYAQRLYLPSPPRNATASSAVSSSPSIETVLGEPLPRDERPLALAVTTFAHPLSGKPVVRATIDVSAFARDAGKATPLDVAVMATDQTGQPLASAKQRSTIAASRPMATEVNVQSHLELDPGEYALRVAVSDPESGKIASVFADVTVPPYGNAALSLSGISVETAKAPSAAWVATTSRVFHRQDRVRAVLQIYQGTERSGSIVPVVTRVEIRNARGVVVHEQSLPFAEPAFINRRAGGIITLPLSALPPGKYLLTLATSSERLKAERSIRFDVQ